MHNAGPYPGRRTPDRGNQSFFGQIKDSLFAVLIGAVIILVACGLLFWNEGRAVRTAQSLQEGLAQVVHVENPNAPLEQNTGKLVHLTGPLKTTQLLSDLDHSVAVHCIKLKRVVEMFQWVEHESKRDVRDDNGETRTESSYTYDTAWHQGLISSSSFHTSFGHNNPTSMSVQAKSYTSNEAFVGAFSISKGLIEKVSTFKRMTKLPENNPNLKVHDGYYYHGRDPLYPQVGDIRVSFEYAGLSGKDTSPLGPPEKVSIVARQLGTHLDVYHTEAGNELEILYMGQLSAKEIFFKEQMTNTLMTWGIRFVGWLLMFIGFSCFSSIVSTLVAWFPVIRELVAMGVGVMNALLSVSLSLTVIALAWIRYRPMLGLSILFLSLFVLFGGKIRRIILRLWGRISRRLFPETESYYRPTTRDYYD